MCPSKRGNKLLQLITNAGSLWSDKKELIKEIKEVSRLCYTCQKCKKTQPRSVICLPKQAPVFQTGTMDLRYCEVSLRRLSASVIVPKKQPEQLSNTFSKIDIYI